MYKAKGKRGFLVKKNVSYFIFQILRADVEMLYI